jgi:hypothetical protein
MRLLLTSSGVSNTSIHNALVDLLGKPIAESSALFIPTAIYPFPRGAGMAWQAISGKAKSPLAQLGWKALGLIPHLDHEDHPDASLANAKTWAARLPVPVYAIDDQTAIKVTDGTVEVVSEGHWKLFTP